MKERKGAWEFAKQGTSWSEIEFTREFIVWGAQRTTPIFKAILEPVWRGCKFLQTLSTSPFKETIRMLVVIFNFFATKANNSPAHSVLVQYAFYFSVNQLFSTNLSWVFIIKS